MEEIMKKTIIIALMLSTSGICTGAQGWPKSTISKEQSEYNAIKLQIARIFEAHTAAGGTLQGGGIRDYVIKFLKDVGTPVSFKIYKEMFPKRAAQKLDF